MYGDGALIFWQTDLEGGGYITSHALPFTLLPNYPHILPFPRAMRSFLLCLLPKEIGLAIKGLSTYVELDSFQSWHTGMFHSNDQVPQQIHDSSANRRPTVLSQSDGLAQSTLGHTTIMNQV